MYERRTYPVELRAAGDGELPKIQGYAAVTDQLSEEMGGWFGSWRERIMPGAFKDALRRVADGVDVVYALLNHDPNYVIASTANGSLSLSEDDRGLLSVMEPMDTPTIRDLVVTPVQKGVLRKMSFGFTVDKEHPETEDGEEVRVIERIAQLFDVSVVAFPAYPQTSVQARSLLSSLGIDAERMTGPELASFMASVSRHLPVAKAQGGLVPVRRGPPPGGSADTLWRDLEVKRHERHIAA